MNTMFMALDTFIDTEQSNTPVNLPYVLTGLAETLSIPEPELSATLWQNSLAALHLTA